MYIILGTLSVPNLGGSINPETGFQLFLTERTAEVTDNNVIINSDIAKIAKVIIFELELPLSFQHISLRFYRKIFSG